MKIFSARRGHPTNSSASHSILFVKGFHTNAATKCTLADIDADHFVAHTEREKALYMFLFIRGALVDEYNRNRFQSMINRGQLPEGKYATEYGEDTWMYIVEICGQVINDEILPEYRSYHQNISEKYEVEPMNATIVGFSSGCERGEEYTEVDKSRIRRRALAVIRNPHLAIVGDQIVDFYMPNDPTREKMPHTIFDPFYLYQLFVKKFDEKELSQTNRAPKIIFEKITEEENK